MKAHAHMSSSPQRPLAILTAALLLALAAAWWGLSALVATGFDLKAAVANLPRLAEDLYRLALTFLVGYLVGRRRGANAERQRAATGLPQY